MQLLRANTQVKVVIGPVVAVGDGFTPVTTLSLGSADEAEALKHDASSVTDISGATFAAITSADGYYNLTLTTSHTDTEGLLTVLINDDSLCLPVKHTFMVLAEAAWDSMFVAKDDGFMDVNVKTIGRADTQETEASNLEAACAAYSATRGLSGTALPNAAADAAGGLPISDAGGLDLDAKIGALTFTVAGDVDVNVQTWGGTAIATPPAVNATQISGSSTAADNVEVVFSTDFATNYNTTLDGWNVNTTHWGGTSVASATVSANVTQISGDSGAADNAEAFFDGTGYAGTNNVIPTVTTVTNVTTVNGLANNVITAAAIADGAFDRATFAADTGLQSVRSNTAQAGGAGTITLDASASATNEFYAGMVIYLTGGTGAGQFGIITEYNATTKVATVHQNWKTNPDNTTTFAILPYGMADTHLIDGRVLTASSAITVGAYIGGTAAHSTQTSVDTIDDFLDTEIVALTTELAKVPKSDSNVTWNATAAAQIQSEANDALTAFWTSPATLVDLVWDEATSGHTTAGTTGKAVADAATGASPSAIADAVWDEVLSGHLTAGTTGNALNAAGSAGDPWSTTLPGAYTGSQAGALLDNIYDQVQQQILVSPVAGNSPERITDTTIRTYSGETVAVQVSGLDEDGDTIDWTALGDLVFVVENELNTDILEIENADITKTATYFQVTIPAATNVADHSYRWAIRKVSTKQVFLRGRLICERAPDNDA